ncbi:MAG: hypothetical protein HRT38_13810 [Alteromonadaceae bacterium]|nr:hypothetical protein [Alteromonadaceae bacterium]
MKIPKIIHQTWENNDIPAKYEPYVSSVRRHTEGWQYYLWTDDSMKSFVETKYPHLLDIYNSYPTQIQRCDLFRYLVVNHYGGIYLDLDIKLVKSFNDIIDETDNIFFVEKVLDEHECLEFNNRDKVRIANYAFGSTPGHPFWEFFIPKISEKDKYAKVIKEENDILESTGPGILSTLIHDYNNESKDKIVLRTPIVNENIYCGCQSKKVASCTVGDFGYHLHMGTWRF